MCGPNQGTQISGGTSIGPVSAPGQHPIPVESLTHPAPAAPAAPSPMAAAMSAPLGMSARKTDPVAMPRKLY